MLCLCLYYIYSSRLPFPPGITGEMFEQLALLCFQDGELPLLFALINPP